MDGLIAALEDFGLWVVFALAVIEGPVVVLAATALAKLGMMDVRAVWAIAILADLFGDALLYLAGRHLPACLPARHRPQILRDKAEALFHRSGARLVVMAKLTHFAGLPTLIAAGFGRMPFGPFLFWNLLATVPKVSAIVLVGWVFWQALLAEDAGQATALLCGLAVALALILLGLRKKRWA